MVQTTLIRDSQVGDDWIRQAIAACPVQFAMDANGNKNGNILTGPVRLAFTDGLFQEVQMMTGDPNSRKGYGCTILFTPLHDMSLFWQEYVRIAQSDFAQNFNPQLGQFVGLVPPWRDGGEKMNLAGYTQGAPFMNVKSGYAPSVVDSRMNPIVDPKQVYAGCWAIVSLQPFAGGKGKPKRGPMFGLQSVMKIADDTNLGGAAPDPRSMFGGVKPIAPPTGGAAQAFAQPGMQPQMPGPGAVNQLMQGGYGQAAAPGAFGAMPQPGMVAPAPADDDPLAGFR
jgi:hypothetical protein